MKKFMAIYNTPAEVMAKAASMTPEQQAEGMQAWFAWRDRCGDHIVDFGAPLMPGQAIQQDGSWSTAEAPTNGYSILQGESLEQVQTLFAGHPHLAYGEGCTVAVHEFAAM
ncbi:MAG: YciI family protein [Bacteroidota bacterium]